MKTKQIDAWLRRNIQVIREEEGILTKIVLSRLNMVNRKHRLETFPFGRDQKTLIEHDKLNDVIRGLLDSIEMTVRDDAEEMGGLQKYELAAYCYNSGDEVVSTHSFSLRVDKQNAEEEYEEGMLSEPTNAQGLVAQLMRHLEATQRTHSLANIRMFQMQQQTIETLTAQVNASFAARTELYQLMETLSSEKLNRDLAIKAEERKGAFQDRLLEELKYGGPIIWNKIAGKKLLPHADPRILGLQRLVNAMSKEQIDKLLASGAFTPEQGMMVMSLFNDLITNEPVDSEDEKDKKGDPPNGHKQPS